HRAARFLDRIVFCMFAEDVGLLPKGIFTSALGASRQSPERLTKLLAGLFAAMADGGFYGNDEIRRFDGHLFAEAEVLELAPGEIALLETVAALEWSEVEPAVFGTLFERGLDPGTRAQIGAHYTSRADIETLVEPVVMTPLRRDWEETRTLVVNVLTTGRKHPAGDEKPPVGPRLAKAQEEARILVRNFLDRLGAVKVLDPACGSGNFLYVTMQKLLDLEREATTFADAHRVGGHFPRVEPRQLWGIEINPYAFELAQMTVWIGYLQWMAQHGFPWPSDPVLKPFDTFRCMDAILDLSDPAHPAEPEWPAVDYIVGNPPFLGGKLLRRGLGDEYVDALHAQWRGRVPAESDLCCYWFEKARHHIEEKSCQRAGLLATQGIRGGTNRKVLERIKQTGDIFFAVSDREWILDGANVHVSLVAFDGGLENARIVDGDRVTSINSSLSVAGDLARATSLSVNSGLAFQGPVKVGAFEIRDTLALRFLVAPNPHGCPNSDVLAPWINGLDLTRRARGFWIIDFAGRGEAEACLYELPFSHLQTSVRPLRVNNADKQRRERWWLLGRSGSEWKVASQQLDRAVFTARVAKFRLFGWFAGVVLPDTQVVAFSRSDDYFFGVLHSRVHEVWALRMGTRLETRPRYTPTTCFETFPFPWASGHEPGTPDDLGQPAGGPPGGPMRGPEVRAHLGAEADDPGRSQTGPRATDHGPQPPDAALVRAISAAAHDLDALRTTWLNPLEWTREEVLTFPGSVDGPWARYVVDPDARGIGTVRYPRIVPKDADSAAKLKARTLTNLYNQRPTWLRQAHERLDAAVFAAYGWDPGMSDETLLESLLALNLARAARS
ncbi:MAG: hypothetical protein MUF10_03690, partial [Thermoanaerobaculaceae bacterium]|nr:hypothetical protein [Thermoanaerobaculaceae bacterium]